MVKSRKSNDYFDINYKFPKVLYGRKNDDDVFELLIAFHYWYILLSIFRKGFINSVTGVSLDDFNAECQIKNCLSHVVKLTN